MSDSLQRWNSSQRKIEEALASGKLPHPHLRSFSYLSHINRPVPLPQMLHMREACAWAAESIRPRWYPKTFERIKRCVVYAYGHSQPLTKVLALKAIYGGSHGQPFKQH